MKEKALEKTEIKTTSCQHEYDQKLVSSSIILLALEKDKKYIHLKKLIINMNK